MKKALLSAVFLAVVAALAGGALTLANDMTIDTINENKIAAEKENLLLIYPDGEFVPVEGYQDDTGLITGIYEATGQGYIYKVAVDGFGGADSIEFMIGFGTDGKISGYTVLTCGDTKDIGTKVTEDAFINSVVGKNIGDSIDTISGATVSSSAVVGGIDAATAHYNANYQ